MTLKADQGFREIGGIVHLDHVNFEVADQDMATMFFVAGLGFTRDPFQRTDQTNMGINVGMEQFHLPRQGRATPPFNGEIGLVVPDLSAIDARLQRLTLQGAFAGTPYSFQAPHSDRADKRSAVVTSPYGFVLRLHEVGTIACQRPLGLAYVEVAVPPGSSAAIGRFYSDMFDAPVGERVVGGEPAVEIAAGPFQCIRFIERDLADHTTHTMHISYYATRFDAVRERLSRADPTLNTARDHVFFFNKIADPQSGEVVFTINNEVRSLYHPDFRRQLVNRWPIVEEPFVDQAQATAARTKRGMEDG